MSGAKHIVITGGSSGIGKATAKLYARDGANVTIIARRQEVLDQAKGEIDGLRNNGGATLALSADVADKPAIDAAMTRATGKFGVPDILMTSSGIAVPGYFEDIPTESFERHMAVNYFGTLYALQTALPAMRERGTGRVVLVSSGAGLIGIFGYTPYSPTKFALRGLAESLRGELRRDGVGVSIVYPPDTDTPQLFEENKTKPIETKAITGTAKTWTADGVAKSVYDGIGRGKFAITPGWEMTWLMRLHSMIRPVLHWQFDQAGIKARRGDNG